MDRASSFLIGLAVGGAVGGVLAILLAPSPGGELRDQILMRGVELKDRAAVVADQVKDRGRLTVDEQRIRLQQAMAEGRDAAAKKRSDLLTKYEQAKGQGQT